VEAVKVDADAAVTNVQQLADNGENILDRVPGGLGMRLKDLPTRRQVLDIRKQAVNAERQVKREQVEKDHELRVSNVCAIKIVSPPPTHVLVPPDVNAPHTCTDTK